MVMRRASILALCSLLLAGCATRGSNTAKGGAASSPSSQATRTLPSPVHVIGRVIAIDPRTLFVMVEAPPYTPIPADFNGRILISRTDDLRPTARLQASPYLRGRMLGTRLLSGRPQVGDEVVIAPVAP